MNRRHTIVVVLLAALLTGAAQALYAMGSSRHVNSANGLSNDFVLSLTIDDDGYVWAATESGLNRIAGTWCRVVATSTVSSGQRICALHYHKDTQQLLIGTETGLCVYDCARDQLRPLADVQGLISYSLDNITPAADGGVWLVYGNGRVQHLDCNTMQATELALGERYGNRCGMDDGQGRLYLGHAQQGMSIVNLADGSAERFTHRHGDATSLPGNNVRCIRRDSHGNIWVGTERGLARFNPVDRTFTKVTHPMGDYDDNVYDIRQMADGALWVATDMGGVRVLSSPATERQPLLFDTVSVQTSSVNVRSIAQDEFGNVWVGNHSTGVDFLSAQKSLFRVMTSDGRQGRRLPVCALAPSTNYSPSTLHPSPSTLHPSPSTFWMGRQDELQLWQDGRMVQRWPFRSSTHREHSQPRCMMADSEGCLWLGMEDEGVVRFHPGEGRFEPIDIGHEGSDIHAFYEDADGRIWIGSEFGVYTYYKGVVSAQPTITELTHNAPVTTFMMLDQSHMLLTTQGMGAYTFDLSRPDQPALVAETDSLPSNKINEAIADRSGGVWMGTAEGLLYVADPLRLKGVTVYGQQSGLADAHIRALRQDVMGRIWVSTFSGVSCLNKASGRFSNYDYFDSQYLSGFAQGAALTMPDGTIAFGSAGGLCLFNPQDFNDAQRVSQVQIVTCEVYNPAGSDTEIVRLQPDADGRIHTSYQQNTLRIAFTLRNFAQTGHEEYSYMMRGMDNKWYYIGKDQDVVFRGLRPGRYTFILRAKLKNQDWDDATQTQIEVHIAPPFWRTWWAYLLYALAALLWTWYGVRSYKRKLKLRNSLELERRESQQKQELNEERLRFFTNITHELRTPLTLILGPLDDLMGDRQLPDATHRKVTMIQKSAQRLQALINDILEFRKTETQNRRLTVARGDLGLFLREICLNYKELYRNPRVQFTYDVPADLPQLYFDSEVVTTIMNNLLSNAIKYTEQGTISVSARAQGDQVVVSVADTGHGISADALPHIFDRYYQAKGSHQASGTGIGLALVKALADLHHMQLSAEGAEGRGSRFTFALSTTDTYPHALHKEDAAADDAQEQGKTATDGEADTDAAMLPLLLVVEDNADIRQYIADSFGDDMRILQAENGEQGVEMAQEHTPDIIVSDIMMPRMNGIELTRQLKGDVRTSHIPIILLTAKTSDEDKEEGYDSGADSYLTKPFTARLLASRIQNLLNARRRLAELLVSPMGSTQQPSDAATEDNTQQPMELSRLDREFLDKLNSVINDNIMSEDIDMAFLTDKMAMSHSTFYRKVKALTGMTAKEFVRKRKLQHCYRLLESGDYNVTEAAMMTGFNQMAHFREVFKQEFGILPSEVMRKTATHL